MTTEAQALWMLAGFVVFLAATIGIAAYGLHVLGDDE